MTDFKGKTVFVSGAAGVIGRPLVQYLYRSGARVIAADLKKRPAAFPIDVQYRRGDLNYLNEQEVASYKPDIVFHLAATFERTTESYAFWEENFKHNLNLSHHLATLFKDLSSLEAFVFASSYLIYDPALYLFKEAPQKARALKETDAIKPRNLTGAAKLNHEVELQFLSEFRGEDVKFINARIYRSFGKGSRDIISRWVRSLLKGEPITVFGGENQFDYIFADDVAEGLVRLCGMDSGIYNLGSGSAASINRVVRILKKHFPEAVIREGEVPKEFEASEADMTKTGWVPETSLEDAISAIIDYEQGFREVQDTIGNVLITSISKKVPLIKAVREGMRRVGGEGRIIGGDFDPMPIGAHFVDEFWQMPAFAEMTYEAFLEYCRERDVRYIIPTRDAELPFFAQYRDAFEAEGVHVFVSNLASVLVCQDKYAFYELLENANISGIPTAKDITELEGSRYVVKENRDSGSRSLGLNLGLEEARAHGGGLKEAIYQPYIEGVEFSADVYVARGQGVKSIILRTRDKVVDGESQITTVFSNEGVRKVVEEVAIKIGMEGHGVIQGIMGPEGGVSIIEANLRFGGASTLSVASGLDTFYWYFLECAGEDISGYGYPLGDSKKLVRYASDIFI